MQHTQGEMCSLGVEDMEEDHMEEKGDKSYRGQKIIVKDIEGQALKGAKGDLAMTSK